MAAGSWLWGIAADGNGVPLALSLAAPVVLLCGVLGVRIPLARAGDST
ncbi:MAG: hypothetical protein JWO25_413 [Alphaproteobacteria bacterium]|nr:hypothetical protein [Alphaproteobacteria bacterium]